MILIAGLSLCSAIGYLVGSVFTVVIWKKRKERLQQKAEKELRLSVTEYLSKKRGEQK